MEAVAGAEHLHLRQVVIGRRGEALERPRREGEGAAVGKVDDNAAARGVVARSDRPRLVSRQFLASSRGGLEFCVG